MLVLQETVTSLLEDERKHTLRVPLSASTSSHAHWTITRFKALVNYERLQHPRISIEISDAKNLKKNPVAERAIQELEH